MNTKTLFLILSVVFFAFSSCGDDEDDTDILGSWRYTPGNSSVAVETNTPAFTSVLTTYLANEAEDSEHILVFKGDGTMMMKYGDKIDFESPYQFSNGILRIAGVEYAKVNINKNIMIVQKDITADFNDKVIIDAIFISNAEALVGVDKANVKINKIEATIKYTR